MVFAGMDTFGYPGDAVMDWLKANTNLRWTGFYLAPAPSHPNLSWMPHRERLVKTGWGLAPIFVGQQTQGPGGHNVVARQGAIDGGQAASDMERAGFPKGSYVYLDLENGLPFPGNEQAYVAAWCGAVEACGFKPGVYCSFTFAAKVHVVVPRARLWTFHIPTTALHNVPGVRFPEMDPASSGYPGAELWQCAMSCRIRAGSGYLVVDLDTSAHADPSAPDVPIEAVA